jgi:hypothetical protein
VKGRGWKEVDGLSALTKLGGSDGTLQFWPGHQRKARLAEEDVWATGSPSQSPILSKSGPGVNLQPGQY